MNIVTGILVYIVLWWLVLFTVLPWGIKVSENPETGFATSAPENPKLWRKFIITTVLAAIAWGCTYLLINSDLITFT